MPRQRSQTASTRAPSDRARHEQLAVLAVSRVSAGTRARFKSARLRTPSQLAQEALAAARLPMAAHAQPRVGALKALQRGRAVDEAGKQRVELAALATVEHEVAGDGDVEERVVVRPCCAGAARSILSQEVEWWRVLRSDDEEHDGPSEGQRVEIIHMDLHR